MATSYPQIDVGGVVGGYNAGANNILGGYGQLSNQVLGGLVSTYQGQAQDIYNQYVGERGKQSQDRVSRGLANTTQRYTDSSSLLGAKWRADAANSNQFAGMMAGYGSQIGLAGLGAAGGFLNSGSQLGYNYSALNNQMALGYLNSPYASDQNFLNNYLLTTAPRRSESNAFTNNTSVRG